MKAIFVALLLCLALGGEPHVQQHSVPVHIEARP